MSEPERDQDRPAPLAGPAAGAAAGRRRTPSLWELWAVIAVGTAVVGGGIDILRSAPASDNVPPEVDAKRLESFLAMSPIPVVPAGDDEQERLAAAMGLPGPEKELLVKTIREEMQAQAPAMKAAAAAPAAARALPKPARPAAARPAERVARPVTLTQITLWDTDAVDGDVVRVVSAGYESEVVLAKTPVTLAVPVPPGGVINIIGVRDGGGGITAGIAVGGRSVELPLMSVGQSLGIPVLVRP